MNQIIRPVTGSGTTHDPYTPVPYLWCIPPFHTLVGSYWVLVCMVIWWIIHGSMEVSWGETTPGNFFEGYVGPKLVYLGSMWAYVGAMLNYVGPFTWDKWFR